MLLVPVTAVFGALSALADPSPAAASSREGLDQLAVRAEMPFAILRSYGSYEANPKFTERVFAAQDRHPGLIEEIWFCGCGDEFGLPAEQGKAAAAENLKARELCRARGIRFSYQQGVTLGHGPDDMKRPGFPDDAWVVDRDGRIRYGLFCCTSPFVKDYSREKAKAIMSALKPDSYWPDDDLRMSKLPKAPSSCFCARCLRLFGARVGRTFDRAGLLAALEGPSASAEIRRAWVDFNADMLGAYAKVYREAADAVSPETIVCQQTSGAANAVNGESYRTILESYNGDGKGTGTRPGGGYYSDQDPFALIGKLITVAKDAARTSKLPFVKQICYEAETWPHIGSLKSPGGLMSECAFAIAVGCDSLALYWGSDINGESPESHDFFLETLADWKPYLLSMRNAFRGMLPGGLAYFVGEGRFGTDFWLRRMDPWHMAALVRNGLPVADQEAYPDAYELNVEAVAMLGSADLPKVFSRPVLMDVATFGALAKRFPGLAAVKKVRIDEPPRERALATGLRVAGFERFGSLGKCEGVKGMIHPLSDDVVRFSELTADPSACGTCLIPTEFGGSIVLVQDAAFQAPGWAGQQKSWAGCRRHGILDALDRAVPGGMPVRLMTDGYACAVVARKTPDGRTGGAFVMNFGTGETPPLELRIRRGVTAKWTVLRPRARPLEVDVVQAGESVVRLPPLPPFGVASVVPELCASAPRARRAVFYHWPDHRFTNLSPVFDGPIVLEKGETLELAYRATVHGK